jgi:hypothetical protein
MTLWLARIPLDLRSRAARDDLADATAMHRRVMTGLLRPPSPGGEGRTWLRKLGGCLDLEPSVYLSSDPRLPGSGSRRS